MSLFPPRASSLTAFIKDPTPLKPTFKIKSYSGMIFKNLCSIQFSATFEHPTELIESFSLCMQTLRKNWHLLLWHYKDEALAQFGSDRTEPDKCTVELLVTRTFGFSNLPISQTNCRFPWVCFTLAL